MQYRRLGHAGLKVSALSLGGWLTFGGSVRDMQVTRDIIVKAYDNGVNFFDIADIYAKGESERFMGQALRVFPRHTLVISSKVFWPMSEDINDRGLSRKHIMESIDKSLQRIGTDYLDMYFCHRYDPDTPLLETMRAMDDLVHQGKVLYWGTSEWSAAQIQDAQDLAEKYGLVPPSVEQPQYHLLTRAKMESEIIPKVVERGMGIVSWSPLASGLLTGKYDEGIPEGTRMAANEWLRSRMTEEVIGRVKRMKAIADGLSVSRAELAIAWVLANPAVSSVITGATRVEQLDANLKAMQIRVTDEIKAELESLFPPDAA